MSATVRCWWSRSGYQQVTLALLVLLSGALLLAADQIVFELDPMPYEGDACVLRNGSSGICRPTNQCDLVLSQPSLVKELHTCSFIQSTPIVCCPVQDEPQAKPTVAQRISIRQCEKYPTPSRLADHIFGGDLATFGEYPYMAALGYAAPNGSEANSSTLFRCGASLISPSYLLTAAHCLRDEPVFARLGVLELQPERVIDDPLDIAIRKAILHPDYHGVTHQNDIALLELEMPIPEWPFVEPVCLYPNVAARGGLSPTQKLTVQGWGSNDTYATNIMPRLKKANVTVIEADECSKSIPPSRRHPNGKLFPGQLCALGRNDRNETTADTCGGDSGGPLDLTVDGRHYLVGITSLGYACGSQIPGIYTEVALYLDWIESIVWSDTNRTTNDL